MDLVNELRNKLVPRTHEDIVCERASEALKKESLEYLNNLLRGVPIEDYPYIRGVLKGYNDALEILRKYSKEYVNQTDDDNEN